MKRLSPADKLFLCHPRFETFAANLASAEAAAGSGGSGGRTLMVQCDAHDAVPLLSGLVASDSAVPEPGVVFIDCEKKTAPLRGLLAAVRDAFPSAVIVGDDLVFPSVKAAIEPARAAAPCLPLEEAYVLVPPPGRCPSGVGLFALARLIAAARESLAPPSPDAAAAALLLSKGRGRDVLASLPHHRALRTELRFADGDTALHEACRQRSALELLAALGALREGAARWEAPLGNAACLLPWDFLTHRLQFFGGGS